jgi:uncharacterized protein (DUF1501 family)
MSPPTLTRRAFLAAGAVGAAGLGAGALAAEDLWGSASSASSAATAPRSGGVRTLVLATLYGGNDGLNTVVPASDPAYQAARPTLGYHPEEVLPLGEGLGFNPKLTNLAQLWKQRQLAVVRGVGYPNPNLSHFDSMAIWQTANPVSGTGPGWLGTWLDGHPGDPLQAISIGNSVPPAMRGTKSAAAALVGDTITLPGSSRIQVAYASLMSAGPDRSGLGAACSASGSALLAAKTELDRLHPTAPSASPGAGASTLGDQLGVVAALIRAGAPARVYQVSLSSFDTHADQKAAHEAKLADLDAGVGAFFKALQGAPNAAGVVLVTYSEFGRRVAQNASGGTDHGTAAPLLVAGMQVNGGAFYGEEPSTTRLDADGNLVYNVDFRSVYATMLEAVLEVNATSVLGAKFPVLDLLR